MSSSFCRIKSAKKQANKSPLKKKVRYLDMKKVIIPAMLVGAVLIAIGCVVEKSKSKPTEDDFDERAEDAEVVEQAEDAEVVEVVS